MRLRLSPTSVAPVAVNKPYTPGRDLRLPYAVELDAGDYPLGTTLVSATLVAEAEFGEAPLLTKLITTTLSANGQITNAGSTGVGALYFALTPSETNQWAFPVAYEIVVVDSLGRQATLDRGALVRADSTQGAPVDHVLVSPSAPNLVAGDPVNGVVQLTATTYDVNNNVLLGRSVTWDSSDDTIATVDASGLVSAVALGSAIITATSEGKSATSAVTVGVMTPAQFAASFNALNLGAPVYGAALRGLYVPGVNQTITPNGGSPTSFYCSFWDDAINPGQGKHMRPASGYANGAPCLVTGQICGEGLEIPSGLGMTGGPVDPTLMDGSNPDIGGGFGAKDFFHRRDCGFTIGAFGKVTSSVSLYTLGEDGAGNFEPFRGAGGPSTNYSFMDDDFASGGFQGSSSIIHAANYGCHFNYTGNVAAMTQDVEVQEWGRDLRSLYWGVPSSANQSTDTRRFRLLHKPPGELDPSVNTAVSAVYFCAGRKNRAQNKLLNDWAQSQPWGTTIKDDTRRLSIGPLGDSFINPVKGRQLKNGANGAAAITNLAIMGPGDSGQWAQSGHNIVTWQYPFVNFYRDCDFSKRPAGVGSIAVVASEYENNSTTGTAGETGQQNAWWLDQMKALDPRIRCAGFNDQRFINTAPDSQGTNAWLDAHLVQDGHAVLLIDLWRTVGNNAYQWKDGTNNAVTGKIRGPVWDPSGHPSEPSSSPPGCGQEYWQQMYRLGVRAGLGDDISAVSFKVDVGAAGAEHQTLTAGAPTYQIVPTAKSATGATLGGKTFTYALGDASHSAYISVNGTGLVTRVAVNPNAQTPPFVKVVSNDGAVGLIAFDCT